VSAGTLQASMTEFQNYLCKLNDLQNRICLKMERFYLEH